MVEASYALAASASAAAAVLAWVAKVRWANEYKEAKNATLRFPCILLTAQAGLDRVRCIN